MKKDKALVLLFTSLLFISGYCTAQIQGNMIAYYPVHAGSCGEPSFTASDSIRGSGAATGLKGGTGAYSFQWKESNDQGATYTAISGANQAVYLPGTLFHTSVFLRMVYSGRDSSSSNTVSLFVSPGHISGNTIHTVKTNLTESDIACGTLSVNPGSLTGPVPTGSSNDNYAYSWASSTDNGLTYRSQGIIATAYDYTPGPLTQTTWFIRVVRSGACADTSAPVKFIFGGISGNIITAPSVISACGVPALSPGMIPGTLLPVNYTYQWQSGPDSAHFTDISGITTRNYDPGILYSTIAFRRRSMTGTCSSYTNAVLFTIVPSFSVNAISVIPPPLPFDAPVFTGQAVTAGAATIRYSWEQSTDSLLFKRVAGNSNFLNYQPPALFVKTWYRRIASSGTCKETSNSLLLSLNKCDTCKVKKTGCTIGASKADMGVHLTRRPGNKGQGLTFDYTLSASNYGPDIATGIIIRDTLNSNMNETGITAVDNGTATYNATSHILTWTIPSMRSSSIATMILSVQPANNNQLISKIGIFAFECDPDLTNNAYRDTINHPLTPLGPVILSPAFSSSIPDIITPNGDGKNDRLVISKIMEPGYANNQINIFDRWGNTVFQVNGYQNDWDGKGLSAGTYFYVLKINTGGNSQLIKGFITLMR